MNPIECPAGSYMPYGVDVNDTLYGSPAKYQDNCIDCPGGSRCTANTVYPYDCGTGVFSKPGKSVCETCEAGYYCDNVTTSYTDMTTNKRCPAGLYCTTGLNALDEAVNCSLSHYCPEGKGSVLWIYPGNRSLSSVHTNCTLILKFKCTSRPTLFD